MTRTKVVSTVVGLLFKIAIRKEVQRINLAAILLISNASYKQLYIWLILFSYQNRKKIIDLMYSYLIISK